MSDIQQSSRHSSLGLGYEKFQQELQQKPEGQDEYHEKQEDENLEKPKKPPLKPMREPEEKPGPSRSSYLHSIRKYRNQDNEDNEWPYLRLCGPDRALTSFTLDVWQRETSMLCKFILKRINFERKMGRLFSYEKDFPIVLRFIRSRSIHIVSMNGFEIYLNPPELINEFINVLKCITVIELSNMHLPLKFYESLRKCCGEFQVQTLILEGTILSLEALINLQTFMIKSKTLRYINVKCCGIDEYSFGYFADGIQKSETISGFGINHLVNSWNTMGLPNLSSIVSCLIWQNKIEIIDMQHCEFTSDDIRILMEHVIKTNSKLNKLILAHNNIDAKGVEALMRAAAHNSAIEYLDISSNNVGLYGAKIIAKLISMCRSLKYLNISYNNIGAKGMNAILHMLKATRKPLTLIIKGNRVDSKSLELIEHLTDCGILKHDSNEIYEYLEAKRFQHKTPLYFKNKPIC